MMSPDEYIKHAVLTGERDGIDGLPPGQRWVYLIAEAETLCDMEGVDAFLRRYGPEWVTETAAAFESVGAAEIAELLRVHPLDAVREDRLNDLVVQRVGYDYEAIRRMAARFV